MLFRSDLGGKRLISLAPNSWVKWLTQNPQLEVREFLSSEFAWLGRANDVLIVEANLVFEENISSLLPFVPILIDRFNYQLNT